MAEHPGGIFTLCHNSNLCSTRYIRRQSGVDAQARMSGLPAEQRQYFMQQQQLVIAQMQSQVWMSPCAFVCTPSPGDT